MYMSAYIPPVLNNGVLNSTFNSADFESTYPDSSLPLSGGNITGGVNVSGNLGVGLTNPDRKVQVDGGIKVKGTGSSPGLAMDNVLHIQRTGNAASYSSYVNHNFYTGSTSGPETGTSAMAINSYGISYTGVTIPSGSSPNTIGFRWSQPFINASVDNVVYGNIATTSDRRLKAKIKSYETGYDDIDKLTPKCYQPIKNIDISKCEKCENGKMKICDNDGVELLYDSSHNYVGDESTLSLGEEMIGFIADEVQPHFPDLVCGEGEDLKSVTYSNFTPILLGCLKTMKLKIQELERELERRNSC